MFTLAKNGIVWWRIDVPDRDDDGELVERPVRFQLLIRTRAELRQQRLDRMRDGATALGEAMQQLTRARTAADVESATAAVQAAVDRIADTDAAAADDLAQRIVGWNAEDITDADTGKPVAFTPELRDALLADEARYKALRRGLQEASEGARRKNSLPGRAGSPAPAQVGTTNGSGTVTTH